MEQKFSCIEPTAENLKNERRVLVMKRSLIIGLFLSLVFCFVSVANADIVMKNQQGANLTMEEASLNAPIPAVVNVSLPDGWRATQESGSNKLGGWSALTGQFLRIYGGLLIKVTPSMAGLDPSSIERVGITFDFGKTWFYGSQESDWDILVDTNETSVQKRWGELVTPIFLIEGKTGWKKISFIIQLGRWKTEEQHYQNLQLMVMEPPRAKKLQDMSRSELFRSCSGLIPAFNVQDEIKVETASAPKMEGQACMRLTVVNENSQSVNGEFTVYAQGKNETEGKEHKMVFRGGRCWLNGKEVKTENGTFTSLPLNAGTTIWVKPKGGDESAPRTIYPGQDVVFRYKYMTSTTYTAQPTTSYRNVWRNLGGNPRALGAINSASDAQNWFLSEAGVNDMRRHGFSSQKIDVIKQAIKANGVKSFTVNNGTILPAGLSFGDGSMLLGPVKIDWKNAVSATGYIPVGVTGMVPIVIGQAVGINGQPIAGCSNMSLYRVEGFSCWKDESPAQALPPITVAQPEEYRDIAFGYLGNNVPTQIIRQTTVGTLEFVPTYNINTYGGNAYAEGGQGGEGGSAYSSSSSSASASAAAAATAISNP